MAQTAINERRVRTQTEKVAFEDLDLRFGNNLEAVGNLISEARKNYFARTKFGNYLEVYCTDVRATISLSLNGEPQFWKQFDIRSSFNPTDIIVSLDNLDSWYEEKGDFTRNMTPYAVYPFSVSNCMGLISGELRLVACLNLSELHRMFSANGWETTEFNREKIEKEWQRSKNERIGDEMFNYGSTMTVFTISRDGFNMALPFAILVRVATDYMRPEVLLEMAEHSYATADRNIDKTFVPSILGEKDVWL